MLRKLLVQCAWAMLRYNPWARKVFDRLSRGKARRKQWKALRDKKRNLEKMIAALQDLRQMAGTPEGEKLRKKFEQEMEKYQ